MMYTVVSQHATFIFAYNVSLIDPENLDKILTLDQLLSKV